MIALVLIPIHRRFIVATNMVLGLLFCNACQQFITVAAVLPDAAQPQADATLFGDTSTADAGTGDDARATTDGPLAVDGGCTGCIDVIIGTGDRGLIDGPIAVAQFHRPNGIAIDQDGTLYIVDTENHAIRTVRQGQVATIAGDGQLGFVDGVSPLSARFDGPRRIALDLNGIPYIADTRNNRIRRIAVNVVETWAGSGIENYRDDARMLAEFDNPYGLAFLPSGELVVADRDNSAIRLIDSSSVSTLSGGADGFADGPIATAAFNRPRGIATTSDSRIIVADSENHRIRVIENGQVTTLAGSGAIGSADGAALTASFNFPLDVAASPNGAIYVVERDGNNIREIRNGQVSTLAGPNGRIVINFGIPRGIAVDSAGRIYVSDSDNHRIIRIVP